jgi:FKBP-type peptidyl-prolyl cis-trans isomerase SlyD
MDERVRMEIEAGTVVTLSYDITNEAGEIIESSEISGPISFIAGKSGMIPGLDKRLMGMAHGDEATFEFPPEEAFGRADDGPERQLSRKEFPADAKLEPGSHFEAGVGQGQTVHLRVVSSDDETVTVKMIHPLAGQKIGMSVKVVGVRAATAAEKEAGKAMTAPPKPPPK